LSLSFQDLILTLHRYWGAKGCVILQPYDMEMGAGTFHPATVLRALGPDPWRAAYVQPCRRPTDGRYGENPNRLGHYYQYQVVLKPSPDDLQDLYLGSTQVGDKGLQVLRAFPDLRMTVQRWVEDGEVVVTEEVMEGTHRGEFAGMAPTGRRVNLPMVHVTRVVEGRIVERVAYHDTAGIVRQLTGDQPG